MPSNVVKTKEEEKKWDKAEEIAKSQGQGGNYAYIMGIFKKMNPDRFSSIVTTIAREGIVASNVLTKMADLESIDHDDTSSFLHPLRERRDYGEEDNMNHRLEELNNKLSSITASVYASERCLMKTGSITMSWSGYDGDYFVELISGNNKYYYRVPDKEVIVEWQKIINGPRSNSLWQLLKKNGLKPEKKDKLYDDKFFKLFKKLVKSDFDDVEKYRYDSNFIRNLESFLKFNRFTPGFIAMAVNAFEGMDFKNSGKANDEEVYAINEAMYDFTKQREFPAIKRIIL